MTAATAGCGFEWCENRPGPHHEHSWHDAVAAKVGLLEGQVYIYASAHDGNEFADQVLVRIQESPDDDTATEGWLSIEDAERLRDILSKAIAYARRQDRVQGQLDALGNRSDLTVRPI